MKRNKKLLILVGILIAVIVACVAVKKLVPDETAETAGVTFSEIKQGDVVALEWKNADETNKFIKNNEGWTLEGDEVFPANEVILDSMENSVVSAKSARALEDVKASEYGIGENSDTVTVYKKDGTVVKMIFGDVNDITNEYYMQVEGDSNVYMIETAVKDTFDRKRDDLIKMEKVPNMTGAEKIVMEKNSEVLELLYTESGEGEEKTSEWKSGDTVLNSDKADALKESLIGIMWNECVDYNVADDELNTFGLDNPAAKLTIETADETAEFLFGNRTGEEVYVKLAGSNMVYTTDKTVFDSIVTDTATLVD